MVSKEELLAMLQRCSEEESHAIRVYAQNADNPLFLSNLKSEEQTRVKELLLHLKRESESHIKTYRQLISTVEASEQDVF
ncbi:MAG TPA: hypothetical protein PLL75_04120 [Candidatus Omnitrophota bacterium]|nr:hypothetical protein [Candidatus Omnitrophota bacterium]HPS36895.1 hypothetical protein [Candidatus Omnitrophota bacterium]